MEGMEGPTHQGTRVWIQYAACLSLCTLTLNSMTLKHDRNVSATRWCIDINGEVPVVQLALQGSGPIWVPTHLFIIHACIQYIAALSECIKQHGMLLSMHVFGLESICQPAATSRLTPSSTVCTWACVGVPMFVPSTCMMVGLIDIGEIYVQHRPHKPIYTTQSAS